MKIRTALLWLLLLLSGAFALATTLQPRALKWSKRAQADNILKVLFGDGRRLFANHFFVKADVYFHSGYYPSIFDRTQPVKDTRHLTQQEDNHGDHDAHGHDEHTEEAEHEKQMSFLGPPKDCFESFGRHFMVTEHTHLSGGAEREILPWLRLSAELDPQRVDTYTVAAYWLRNRLGKVNEAEQFLREGLRANPESYEILFELGRLYHENHKDSVRARNLWEQALRHWVKQQAGKQDADLFALEQIAVNLSRLEEEAGNFRRAIELLELAKKASPNPQSLQQQIEDLKRRL